MVGSITDSLSLSRKILGNFYLGLTSQPFKGKLAERL